MRPVTKSLIIIVAVLVFNAPYIIKVSAATTNASYTIVNTDQSKKFSDSKGHSIKLNYYYKRIKLKGNSAAVKKINKQLKAYSDKFLGYKSLTYKMVKESLADYSGQIFINTATSKVVYNKKGIISIAVTTEYYEGGVCNIDTYGYTFRLKDGELLKITDVCKGTKKNIKNAIWNEVKAAEIPSWNTSFTLSSISLSKVNFYLKSDNKVVVCFNCSDIGSNSSIKCTFDRTIQITTTLDDGNYAAWCGLQSDSKNSFYAKEYGNIYKLKISGNKIIMYGSFSKDGKKYSNAKRIIPLATSYIESSGGAFTVSFIKDNNYMNLGLSFSIKDGIITNLLFAG